MLMLFVLFASAIMQRSAKLTVKCMTLNSLCRLPQKFPPTPVKSMTNIFATWISRPSSLYSQWVDDTSSIRYSFTSNTRCWYCAQLTHAHVSRGGAHAGAAQHRVCVRAAHVECVHGWSGAPPLVQLRPCLPSRTPAPLGQHVDVKLTKEGRRLWRALLLYRGGWRRR